MWTQGRCYPSFGLRRRSGQQAAVSCVRETSEARARTRAPLARPPACQSSSTGPDMGQQSDSANTLKRSACACAYAVVRVRVVCVSCRRCVCSCVGPPPSRPGAGRSPGAAALHPDRCALPPLQYFIASPPIQSSSCCRNAVAHRTRTRTRTTAHAHSHCRRCSGHPAGLQRGAEHLRGAHLPQVDRGLCARRELAQGRQAGSLLLQGTPSDNATINN